ncbi:MAG: MinD/ParA family protein [Tissierellales bacterium]|nr:MinD/ParA family protein [Tissierellales bacterium]
MIDQASNLRKIIDENSKETEKKNIKIYSVLSGKGGVGKTNFSVNLGIKFTQKGKRVLIIDADVGMTNANIVLGIPIRTNLFDLIKGNKTVGEIITKSPYGVDLISGGSELLEMEKLNFEKQKWVLENLRHLENYDIIIIDNGAGMTKQTISFSLLSDEIILITTPEPTALTDAYRVIKVISNNNIKDKVKVIINQVDSKSTGDDTFNKLLMTVNTFLDISIENTGYIYSDIRVNKAIMDQNPFVIKYPNSLASESIENICSKLIDENIFIKNISNAKELRNKIYRIFG